MSRAAEELVTTANRELKASEAGINSEHNLIVLYPTNRPSEEASPPLSQLHAAMEPSLAPSNLSQFVIDSAGVHQPVLAQFYRPRLQPEHLNAELYNSVIQQVLAGMTRANLVQVCIPIIPCVQSSFPSSACTAQYSAWPTVYGDGVACMALNPDLQYEMQTLIPKKNCHPEVLHCHIRNSNNMNDVVEHAYQYTMTPDMQPRDLTLPENSPDTWPLTKSYHSSRQPEEWVAKGADFARCVKDELGVGKSITGRTGGQCSKLEGSIAKLWDKHRPCLNALAESLAKSALHLESKLQCSFAECPLDSIPHYLQSALEACRRCNNELSSAQPDVAVLQQYVTEYEEAVKFFSHESMLRPVRYIPKAYDHLLIWHMLFLAREMADNQALSLGALGSSALESLNKFLKNALRHNVGGGRKDAKHEYSNDRLVRAFLTLSADLRCMRQRWYVEQEALWKKRKVAEAAQ